MIRLLLRLGDKDSEWGIIRVTVSALTRLAVAASTVLIMFTANAGHADGLDSARSGFAGNETVTEGSDAAASTWDWRLAGIVQGPNLRIALFAQLGKTRAVPEGKVIDGWIVTSVGRNAVTLSAAGQTRVIHLEGMLDDEATEAARQRADEIARADAPVVETSRQHDRERDEAMSDLAEATRRMTGR
jgi:hypothetical protein